MPNNQAISEEQPVATLGSHFRSARTNQGKSLKEAARVTCINSTILANLEADNFTKMPAEVFTKGFIKLYAQYLGLDINETLKLYVNKENLDPERPVEQPHHREVHSAAALAHPRNLFKSNPRALIVAILLAVLLAFYALGAIIKVGQKPADQSTPENELAKSLVDGTPQPLPDPPGEPTSGMEETGQTATQPDSQPETQPGAGSTSGPPPTAYQPATINDRQPLPPVAEKTAPATSVPPEMTGSERVVGEAANGR